MKHLKYNKLKTESQENVCSTQTFSINNKEESSMEQEKTEDIFYKDIPALKKLIKLIFFERITNSNQLVDFNNCFESEPAQKIFLTISQKVYSNTDKEGKAKPVTISAINDEIRCTRKELYDNEWRKVTLETLIDIDKTKDIDPIPYDVASRYGYAVLDSFFKDDILADEDSEGYITYHRQKAGYYTKTNDGKIRMLIKEVFPDFSPQKITSIKESVKLACRYFSLKHYNEDNYVNFKNGYLDLKSGKFYPITESDEHFILDPVQVYDPSVGESELFIETVKQWFPGCSDSDLNYILELIAYLTIVPHKDYQVWVNFFGRGANGKSTLLNVMSALIGDSNCTDADLSKWNRFTTSAFVGKRLVVCRDSSHNIEDSPSIKQLVGDDYINVEPKGKTAFSYKHKLKLVVSTNDILRSSDRSHGWFRKIISIPFVQQFKKSKSLEKKLLSKEELQKILNTLLKHAIKLEQRGEMLDIPDFINDQATQIKELNDPVFSWWNSLEPNDLEEKWYIKDAYLSFNAWYTENYAMPSKLSLTRFGGENGDLMRSAVNSGYVFIKGKNGRFIKKAMSKGVDLNPTPDTNPTPFDSLSHKEIKGIGVDGVDLNQKKHVTPQNQKNIAHIKKSTKPDTPDTPAVFNINSNKLKGDDLVSGDDLNPTPVDNHDGFFSKIKEDIFERFPGTSNLNTRSIFLDVLKKGEEGKSLYFEEIVYKNQDFFRSREYQIYLRTLLTTLKS